MHCSCVFSASGLVQNAKCKRWNKTHLKTFEREPAQFPRYSYADLFKWQKRGFSLFFFFFPFFFWFIGIEKKSSYDRWAFLVYLLKFLHFCAYVPNPQNESGKMLSEWTEWGSSFTSELSRLNNEGLRQPHGTQHQPLKLQHLPGSQRSDPWQFKCNVLQLWGVLDLCVTCPY